jgi:hypothetical protein
MQARAGALVCVWTQLDIGADKTLHPQLHLTGALHLVLQFQLHHEPKHLTTFPLSSSSRV